MNYRTKPTAKDIITYVDKVNKKNDFDYQNYLASIRLTETFASNDNYQNIYIKVNFINGAYKTAIGDTMGVAKHINRLKNIDERLMKGDENLIQAIAEFKTSKNKEQRRNYSFATKYCHCHRPELFFIYDKYVGKSLAEFNKYHKFSKFTKKSLYDYHTFKQVLDDFKIFIGDKKLEPVILDRFLWKLGQIEARKKEKEKNRLNSQKAQ